jgi:metal-responsive CopG/Arc/MetJ family transcriptional regulator
MKAMGHTTGAVRASISFPADIYQTLEEIARQKKVSLAWVVREAAEKYVAEKWPLFSQERSERQ